MPTRSEILQAHKDALAQADEERRKALSILAAEEAAHRKARAKRQAAGTAKMRSFRVPDERWERAKAIAEAQSTTVSALINEFLEGLTEIAIARIATKARRQMLRDPSIPKSHYGPGGDRPQGTPTVPAPDPALCEHTSTKQVGELGIFCIHCGKRQEEVAS